MDFICQVWNCGLSDAAQVCFSDFILREIQAFQAQLVLQDHRENQETLACLVWEERMDNQDLLDLQARQSVELILEKLHALSL